MPRVTSKKPKRPKKSLAEVLKDFDLLPDAANVRQPIVEALFDCSPATVWRGVKAGRIPKPDKFSPRITTWNVGRLRGTLRQRPA